MIPTLCSILFTVLFVSVWVGAVVTGSFDRQSYLYSGRESMFKYFTVGLVAVFFLTMLLEYVYELNPKQKIIEPSSYIFVIDESGSMGGNDPNGLRYDAIREIMADTDNTFPYMVYSFSSEPRVLRNMGTLLPDEPDIPVTCDGATSIRETTLRILQDYKEKKWNGGDNPKIIFLTDGYATDLATAMKTAAASYSEQDLLSVRYMKHMNSLFGFFRIIFLSLIGILIGGLLSLAYMDNNSIPLILANSTVGSIIGSILLEIGVQGGVYQSMLWFLLWILFAATMGYIYTENNLYGIRRVKSSHNNKQTKDCQIENGQVFCFCFI